MKQLRAIFRFWRAMIDALVRGPSVRPSDVPSFVLIAPSYDRLTNLTAAWMQQLAIPRHVNGFWAVGAAVSRGDVFRLLYDVKDRFSVAIFCGHGTSHALLGTKDQASSNHYRAHSVVYDNSLLEVGPTAMFAFCCSAGKALGPAFASGRGRIFIGYDGDLPIFVGEKNAAALWESVVVRFCSHLLNQGYIGRNDDFSLQRLYEEELSQFLELEGLSRSVRLLMRSYVKRHKKLIRRYAC